MNKSEWGFHIGHCCKWHGCKYGDKDCPVVNGFAKQTRLCESCAEDLEYEKYYKEKLQDIVEIKQFMRGR